MATHSSILAWKIPWTEEPGGLQSTGSKRVGYDWACTQMVKNKNQQGSKVICDFPSWSSWLSQKETLKERTKSEWEFLNYLWFWRELSMFQNQIDTVLTIFFKWRILFQYFLSFLPLNQCSLSFFCYLVQKAPISWLSVFSTFVSLFRVFDCLQTKKANNLFLSKKVLCLQESESISDELGLETEPRRGFRWRLLSYQSTHGMVKVLSLKSTNPAF